MDAKEQRLDRWLTSVTIDPAIVDLRPDYCAGLMAVAALQSGPTDSDSDLALKHAEQQVREGEVTIESDEQVEMWRDAYRSFGAKPKRTRPSVDALRRRALRGDLPRINRITDHYNAISMIHGVPIGVEDIERYDGTLRLVRSDGTETFATTDHGTAVTETVDVGEPIWRDDSGATCRRWNWRQTTRTAINDTTTTAIFIVDTLGPGAYSTAQRVVDELRLIIGPDAATQTRTIQRLA